MRKMRLNAATFRKIRDEKNFSDQYWKKGTAERFIGFLDNVYIIQIFEYLLQAFVSYSLYRFKMAFQKKKRPHICV